MGDFHVLAFARSVSQEEADAVIPKKSETRLCFETQPERGGALIGCHCCYLTKRNTKKHPTITAFSVVAGTGPRLTRAHRLGFRNQVSEHFDSVPS